VSICRTWRLPRCRVLGLPPPPICGGLCELSPRQRPSRFLSFVARVRSPKYQAIDGFRHLSRRIFRFQLGSKNMARGFEIPMRCDAGQAQAVRGDRSAYTGNLSRKPSTKRKYTLRLLLHPGAARAVKARRHPQ